MAWVVSLNTPGDITANLPASDLNSLGPGWGAGEQAAIQTASTIAKSIENIIDLLIVLFAGYARSPDELGEWYGGRRFHPAAV